RSQAHNSTTADGRTRPGDRGSGLELEEAAASVAASSGHDDRVRGGRRADGSTADWRPPAADGAARVAHGSVAIGAAEPGIEGAAQAVAEQVDRQHGQEDGEAREGGHPPRLADEARAVAEVAAPARGRRADADTEEAEARLHDDRHPNQERRLDDEA